MPKTESSIPVEDQDGKADQTPIAIAKPDEEEPDFGARLVGLGDANEWVELLQDKANVGQIEGKLTRVCISRGVAICFEDKPENVGEVF